QFARLARRADLRNEEVILKIGSLVRRMLSIGIDSLQLVRLIDLLCERNAWTAAETVIDECTLGPRRVTESRIPRGLLSPVAWKVALQGSPPSLLGALRALHRADQLSGNWTVPPNVP